MKGYVITIKGHEQSEQAAKRCVKSASRWGFEVEHHIATTPKSDPETYLAQHSIPVEGFREVYSRFANCVSAFTSHFRLWQKSVQDNETLLVLEHDAYFVDSIPKTESFDIINFGKPSYGNFINPSTVGMNALISKQYLPGAHAYQVTPRGAYALIQRARECAGPTDVFINNRNFPNMIGEWYPWPVEARDSFSTIQNERGCHAKHGYQKQPESYELL